MKLFGRAGKEGRKGAANDSVPAGASVVRGATARGTAVNAAADTAAKSDSTSTSATTGTPPVLARRSLNRHSHLRSGRTIAESREHLETAAERTEAHRKIKHKKHLRIFLTIAGFTVVAGGLAAVALFFAGGGQGGEAAPVATTIIVPPAPTIEIVDEGASGGTGGSSDGTGASSSAGGSSDSTGTSTSHGITSRMREYIALAEQDFRELGYTPVRAVIPAGAIREVDFYLDGYPGRIKLYIDRGSGVSVEDADRMLRYLAGQGITKYEYIDVRIDGKAYWK